MDRSKIYETIKHTVLADLPDARVVLFGSHARGDSDDLSDYDLLVITTSTFTQREKINWSTRLDRAIIEAIHLPIDLLLSSEEEIAWQRELPGHIVRTALREGIIL